MRVSLFYELTVPRPWDAAQEKRIFDEHLEAAELADRLGFHAVWITEHHFLEEMTHASAPEVVLAAIAGRTTNLRLGHGIVHMPPAINHPARVAERIGTLDLISGGRVEFGTGEASSEAELAGFNVDPPLKRAMWREGVKVATRCMYEEPFTGFEGQFVSMPPRNVVPKPMQKPHPPVWVACTRPSTVVMAAENGLGALSFSFVGPEECVGQVKTYYETFERAVPMLPSVNPNTLFLGGNMSVAKTREEAVRRIGFTGGFFGWGIGHYYVTGTHIPGHMHLWDEYTRICTGEVAPMLPDGKPMEADREDWARLARESVSAEVSRLAGVGTPDEVLARVLQYEAAGCDELLFQLPPIEHDWNMESIELLGRHVVPVVHERNAKLAAEKRDRLSGTIEAVEARYVDDAPAFDPNYSFGGPTKAMPEIVEAMKHATDLRQRDMREQRTSG